MSDSSEIAYVSETQLWMINCEAETGLSFSQKKYNSA